ncbi:MAG: winged helix-turn-helix domain-containing protein [Gammaproteobacteria bacterium]|jgi:two-component system phosphate regulon response regulator PhoB
MRSDILIVQPDPKQSAEIRELLESNGHAVIEAASAEAASRLMEHTHPDAVLVQWSTTTAARSFLDSIMHTNGHANACAIVTARDAELSDALAALDMGYDDCVRIPADKNELLARLNASLRRRVHIDRKQLSTGPLVLDKKVHCLCVNGEPVELAPTEFRLINFFMENPGRVFSRDEILKGAWRTNITAGSRTVDVHVRRLRQVLEPYGCDKMIQTVRSFGYRFRETLGES